MRWGPRVSDTLCPVSTVDHGQRGQLGPGGPRAVTQRRAPGVPRRRRRGFAAGDQNSGGARRTSPGIAHRGLLARDLARSNEEIPPRHVVRPAEAGAAGNGAGDKWWRWWRSGPRRDRATGVDEVGKRHGRPRRAALSTFPCSGEHGNDGGQLLGGSELGHGGTVAMVAQEARGASGEEEGLTGRHTRWPSEV